MYVFVYERWPLDYTAQEGRTTAGKSESGCWCRGCIRGVAFPRGHVADGKFALRRDHNADNTGSTIAGLRGRGVQVAGGQRLQEQKLAEEAGLTFIFNEDVVLAKAA